jgi:hypothetical protein
METGGWNYAKRPRPVWSAPVVRQVFSDVAAARYGRCLDDGCSRFAFYGKPVSCRPICELAVEARLRTLGTGATSPDGPTYFDQPSDLTPDRFGVCWTEDAPRPMVLTPWNMRGTEP